VKKLAIHKCSQAEPFDFELVTEKGNCNLLFADDDHHYAYFHLSTFVLLKQLLCLIQAYILWSHYDSDMTNVREPESGHSYVASVLPIPLALCFQQLCVNKQFCHTVF